MWKFQATLETAFCERVSLCPPSYSEGLRDIQHGMSMVLNTRFYVWFIMTPYCKMLQILLQNAAVILLPNATEIYNKMRQVFYKMRQFYHKMQHSYCKLWRFYYKMWQLLQNATFITNCYSTYDRRSGNKENAMYYL